MSFSEWKEVELGDLVEIKGGKRLPKGMSLTTTKTNHPYIRVRDMNGGKVLNLTSDFEYIEPMVQESIKRYTVDSEDIIISIVGTIGLVSKVGKSLDKSNLTENCVKLINLREVDTDYLYYVLTSPNGQNEMMKGTVGSTQPKLPIYNIKKIKLLLPPLQEQKAIAHILSTLDEKIEVNSKINKTLEEMAQTIFKHWFVDFEFPNEDGEPYKSSGGEMVDSELGFIPKGWEVKKAEEIANINIGKTPPREIKDCFSYNSNDMKWISIKDLGNAGVFIFESSEYLKRDAIEKYNVKVVPDSTVVLSFKLTVGRVAITVGDMTTNEAIAHFNLKLDSQLSKEYLYLYLRQFDYGSLGNTSSIASAVNSKIIKSMNILLPDESRLLEFLKLTNPIFETIKKNSQENIVLNDIRDTLLPKLMSGEIRVPIDNEQ